MRVRTYLTQLSAMPIKHTSDNGLPIWGLPQKIVILILFAGNTRVCDTCSSHTRKSRTPYYHGACLGDCDFATRR